MNFFLLYKKQENSSPEIRLSPLYDIVSTVYYPELSRDMAMERKVRTRQGTKQF
jgi:serine/threonine protein kinase HipA of HipAB toxin-antitoxin module